MCDVLECSPSFVRAPADSPVLHATARHRLVCSVEHGVRPAGPRIPLRSAYFCGHFAPLHVSIGGVKVDERPLL